jgi:hypothetical protein
MSFAPRTIRGGAEFPGWSVAGERLLRDADGNLTWLVDAPRRRTWSSTGVLSLSEPVEWELRQTAIGATLLCSDPDAEVDAVELRGDAARTFERDASAPMTVIPSFRPLAGPEGLGDYLVGGRVVTGAPLGRWQVEQAALSIYRIARLRGGAFWQGVAAHVADAVARRVEEAPGGQPVTDHWQKGEAHVRFVADAALLLAAHAELSGEERFKRATERAADALESFAVPLGGGRWYLHDSVEEAAGRNDLVLNTHVHTLTALRACDRDVGPGLQALDAALAPRARGVKAIVAGASVGMSDLVRALAPLAPARRLARSSHARVARRAVSQRALRLPGGYLARDASGVTAPSTYLAVNVSDLAVLQRNTPTDAAGTALAEGLRYARRFAYMRAELRDERAGAQVLMPHALRNAGYAKEATRAARHAEEAGMAPLVGWPGYEDSLWGALASGTP